MSVVSQRHRFRLPCFMNRLLSSERAKWIFVIGVIAIGAGYTAKNVISYPTECIPGAPAEVQKSGNL